MRKLHSFGTVLLVCDVTNDHKVSAQVGENDHLLVIGRGYVFGSASKTTIRKQTFIVVI